jgi:hypothetical protein
MNDSHQCSTKPREKPVPHAAPNPRKVAAGIKSTADQKRTPSDKVICAAFGALAVMRYRLRSNSSAAFGSKCAGKPPYKPLVQNGSGLCGCEPHATIPHFSPERPQCSR